MAAIPLVEPRTEAQRPPCCAAKARLSYLNTKVAASDDAEYQGEERNRDQRCLYQAAAPQSLITPCRHLRFFHGYSASTAAFKIGAPSWREL